MAARFWRLYFPVHETGHQGTRKYNSIDPGVSLSAVELRAESGGPSLSVGTGGFQNHNEVSSYGKIDPNKAFITPYTSANLWRTPSSGNSVPTLTPDLQAYPHWLGYDFGDGNNVEIEELVAVGTYSGSRIPPTRILLQYADTLNGPWTTKFAWNTPKGWPSLQSRTFNAANASPLGDQQTYMLDALSLGSYPTETIKAFNGDIVSSIRQTALVRTNTVSVLSLVYIQGGSAPDPDIELPPEQAARRRRNLILGLSAVPEIVFDPPPPPAFPGTVTDLSVEVTSTTTMTLLFTNSSSATTQQYRLNGGIPVLLPSNKVLTGLTPDTTYTIEVRGVNSSGTSPWSNVATGKTWQPIAADPNDVDGDGIPNINDPDHASYDPNHPDSDPDGDGLKNKDDPDDNNDGILDINDPTHPNYDPDHPDSDKDGDGTLNKDDPDFNPPPPPPSPVTPTAQSGTYMYGWKGSFPNQYPDNYQFIRTDDTIAYGATGGTGPYTYAWTMGTPYQTNHGMGEPSISTAYIEAQATTGNTIQGGGPVFFGGEIKMGSTVDVEMTCTITDSLGATAEFKVNVQLTHADLR